MIYSISCKEVSKNKEIDNKMQTYVQKIKIKSNA